MNEPFSLPLPAEQFIPHRLPMQLVDILHFYENGSGIIEAVIRPDCPLVNGKGELDSVGLVELIAQGYAAISGYEDVVKGKAVCEGFLVGVKKLRVTGSAQAGDRLMIYTQKTANFEGFALVDGRVERDGEIIVSGSIKLWTPVQSIHGEQP